MFAALVQGPLPRLVFVGVLLVALQNTLFVELRPAGRHRADRARTRRGGRAPAQARRRARWPGSSSG